MLKSIAVCMTAFVCLLASCSQGVSEPKCYNQGINVIPTPASLVQNEGNFQLKKSTKINASTPEAKIVAEYFAAQMNLATGYQVAVSDDKSTDGIALIVDESLEINNEGYTLDVTPTNVTIKAKNAHGLFYGMQTLMQLFPAEIQSKSKVKGIAWTAPCVSVKDEPRFLYRGVMLDPCRHFIPVENIKKYLDIFALFKINRFHWHLTEDQGWRIEIKKYPKLIEIGSKRINGDGSEHGGFYTQEEIKEIVQYAADRFITVVPEIELPGHGMAAIAAYPELCCTGDQGKVRNIWGIEEIVYCAGKETTFEFLQNVLDEVIPLFPYEYIHIGGDECRKEFWRECPHCQKRIREEGLRADKNHTAEEKLQSYFIKRIEKYLAEKHNKKIIGWDEILEGGVSPTATVMSWTGEKGGIIAAALGNEVIMTPSNKGLYVDNYQGDSKIEPIAIGGYAPLEKIYAYDPIPDTLAKIGKSNAIIGVQCNLWGEYLYNTDILEYRGFPRILALSEIAWSELDRKDYKDFERRVDNGLVRLDAYDINYYIPQPEQPNGSCNFVAFVDSVSLEFKSTRPVKMVYTTDESEPTASSAIYTTPIPFTESGVLKIRSVLPSGKMSKTRTITVEKQTLAPAKEVANVTPGLIMEKTFGSYLNVAELAKATDWEKSTIKNLAEINKNIVRWRSIRAVKPYSAIATGYINIPEDGVYFISSDNEEVWIDGKLIINNAGETKRFSRNDTSLALAKGLHEVKVVFLGNRLGGWPTYWNLC
ncbi:MAG: family 20 glycosylhydrolase, partial [Parabacteroides sp.]|nr:family 20 glycosylhydrolase [Parabacteroides sp.]